MASREQFISDLNFVKTGITVIIFLPGIFISPLLGPGCGDHIIPHLEDTSTEPGAVLEAFTACCRDDAAFYRATVLYTEVDGLTTLTSTRPTAELAFRLTVI